MKIFSRRWLLLAATLVVAASAVTTTRALGSSTDPPGAASGLGQLSGLLPRDQLTEESAIQVDLTKESVRLPLYQGKAGGQTVWFVLLDASDAGLAHDLGVNFAPKLANLGIGCPACVQTVTLDSPTPQANRFGQALVNFQGAPDFSPTRIAEPGPGGFPLARFQPGAVAGPGYSPFIRIAGSPVVYSAPIVATGDGPFDVVHHSNTGDRVLGVHIAPPSPPGQSLTAVLERSTLVPALDTAAYNGGDDFLGSGRERLFGFINGQSGADNKQAQGFVHLATDGHLAEDASAQNTALIDALRNGGDLLNVFGDFPTLRDPRHAQAYSPLWDAQLGLWTPKAVQQGRSTRQIDEVQVFNLAASRPDLLTGVDPASGQPAPYGSVGVDINCAVIGFTAKAPTANLADPLPNSQFPPR